MQNERLIFDLGMMDGTDTKYYLSKGYNVVAVEANPNLVEENKIKFKEEIKAGKLIIKNRAISNIVPSYVAFELNKNNLDLSRCISYTEDVFSKDNVIRVEAITYKILLEVFGVPYYVKCDVEGLDIDVAKQIYLYSDTKPKYVSFELNKTDYFSIFSYLHLAGYTKFQLRNQENNEPYSSGDFAEFLPEDKWVTVEEAMKRYLMFRELRDKDYDNLSKGWLDLHATIS